MYSILSLPVGKGKHFMKRGAAPLVVSLPATSGRPCVFAQPARRLVLRVAVIMSCLPAGGSFMSTP